MAPQAPRELTGRGLPSAKLWLGAGDCLAAESRAQTCASHSPGPWQAIQPYCPVSVISLCWTPGPLVWAPLPLGERVWLRQVPGSTTSSVLGGEKLELHWSPAPSLISER